MKRLSIYAAFGLAGLGIGIFSALAMSGLLPGDRRATTGTEVNGWTGDLSMGSADASPYMRARIARHGLLAMAKSEAIYFIRDKDSEDRPLNEQCTYRVSGGRFPAGWWSITLYNADNFLPDNNDKALSFDASRAGERDWSAIIAPSAPADGSNWISSRNAGNFDLTLRLYMPEDSALAHPAKTIAAPNVERLECMGGAA